MRQIHTMHQSVHESGEIIEMLNTRSYEIGSISKRSRRLPIKPTCSL
ncbi:hypothetical protein PO124_23955 [Bacillus licheniformis]|nr:hypothetical protein [Bacillus licheniformis]